MQYNTLDLFCGAGGLTLGMQNAGLISIGAVEMDRFACQTFSANFADVPVYERDVKSFSTSEIKDRFSGVDVIVAGPPCQGFSVAGPSQYGIIDNRNSLIMEVARFIDVIRPAICVLENVKGILHGKLSPKNRAIDEYVGTVERMGYHTRLFVLQTADFGVPQWRERVFIFAARKAKYLPLGIYEEFVQDKGKYWRTVWEAIGDLPQIDSGEGSEELMPYTCECQNEYQRKMRIHSPGVRNHVAMKHTPRLIERFKCINPGKSLVHVPPEHGQRRRNGQDLDVCMRFKMNNQRLELDKVSTAITASFQSNFVHPILNRNLTAREGARLQSYPDRFVFCGPRTLMSKKLLMREHREDEIGLSQYNQIGNSVPPLLAEVIGKAILKRL